MRLEALGMCWVVGMARGVAVVGVVVVVGENLGVVLLSFCLLLLFLLL